MQRRDRTISTIVEWVQTYVETRKGSIPSWDWFWFLATAYDPALRPRQRYFSLRNRHAYETERLIQTGESLCRGFRGLVAAKNASCFSFGTPTS